MVCVPIVSVPPAATVILPCTNVKLLLATVLNWRVPLTVVVLAVAVFISSVTVCPDLTKTALQLVGINPVFHVPELDQLPVWALVTSWQVLATAAVVQTTLLLTSLLS